MESDSASPNTPRTVRVAACQLSASNNLQQGLDAIEKALASAAAKGAQIACFPETCLLGWVNPDAWQLADTIPGPTTDRLGEMARRYKLMIAIGLAEVEADQLYDSAVLIDANGEILMRHRKVNILSELMDPPYKPGGSASKSVVDTPFGRIGMLICADTFKDDIVGEIAAAKPDLVLVPYGWAAPEDQWPEHGKSLQSWVAHTARRTSAPVVGVDAIGSITHGPWEGHLFGGQSVICNKSGEVTAVMADRAPEVRVFEIELTQEPTI